MKNIFRTAALAALIALIVTSCGGSNNEVRQKSALKKAKTSLAPSSKKSTTKTLAGSRMSQAENYIERNGFSTEYCFMIDMSVHSGRNRFFVYNLKKNSIAMSGLVAHGSCYKQFLSRPKFSNAPGCGCTSLGKYKVDRKSYYGEFGKSYRLFGLEKSNSNALRRAVVLHGYDCVPNKEIYPMVFCNSYGCPMVSPSFFRKLSKIIEKSDKPILLWIYQ